MQCSPDNSPTLKFLRTGLFAKQCRNFRWTGLSRTIGAIRDLKWHTSSLLLNTIPLKSSQATFRFTGFSFYFVRFRLKLLCPPVQAVYYCLPIVKTAKKTPSHNKLCLKYLPQWPDLLKAPSSSPVVNFLVINMDLGWIRRGVYCWQSC